MPPLFLMHSRKTDPGWLSDWAMDKYGGFDIEYAHLLSKEELNAINDNRLIVVFGGAVSVTEIDNYVWMQNELLWLRDKISKKRKILGICLGAQLIALAINQKVLTSKRGEYGYI